MIDSATFTKEMFLGLPSAPFQNHQTIPVFGMSFCQVGRNAESGSACNSFQEPPNDDDDDFSMNLAMEVALAALDDTDNEPQIVPVSVLPSAANTPPPLVSEEEGRDMASIVTPELHDDSKTVQSSQDDEEENEDEDFAAETFSMVSDLSDDDSFQYDDGMNGDEDDDEEDSVDMFLAEINDSHSVDDDSSLASEWSFDLSFLLENETAPANDGIRIQTDKTVTPLEVYNDGESMLIDDHPPCPILVEASIPRTNEQHDGIHTRPTTHPKPPSHDDNEFISSLLTPDITESLTANMNELCDFPPLGGSMEDLRREDVMGIFDGFHDDNVNSLQTVFANALR